MESIFVFLLKMPAQSVVRTSCGYSYQIDCNIGVRQGCPLSPTLFSLFVSDLMDRMRDKTGGVPLNRLSVHGLMFADDVVLVAETQEKLQAMLDELSMYCSDWKLEVNTEKTKIVELLAVVTGNCSSSFTEKKQLRSLTTSGTWALPSHTIGELHKESTPYPRVDLKH